MLPPLSVSGDEVQRRIDGGERIVFLDTRSPDEWDVADRQVAGAMRFQPSEIENHLRFVPQRHPVVTYCDCPNGQCSTRAAAALVENGWKDVHPLQPGAWRRFPTSPVPPRTAAPPATSPAMEHPTSPHGR